MATVEIKNSLTNTKAAKRSRYEKMEVAYGKIPAAAWQDGDTLSFTQIPLLNLIHARFVSSSGTNNELEIFTGADLTNPINWNLVAGSETDISYVISYIRGTGKVDGNTDQGKIIKLTVTVNA